MKKILILMIILAFSFLTFGEEQAQEKTDMQKLSELISNYRNERNCRNFQQAIDMINEMKKESEHRGYLMAVQSFLYSMHSDELLIKSTNYADDMNFGQLFFIGNQFLEKNNYEKSIEIYKKAIKANPNSSCVWRHKGEAYYLLSDFDNAKRSMNRSIELNEDHTDAYYWLALVLIGLEDHENALNAIDKGIVLFEGGIPGCEDEQLYEYYELKGDILVNLENIEEAIGAYKQSLETHSNKEFIKEKISALE